MTTFSDLPRSHDFGDSNAMPRGAGGSPREGSLRSSLPPANRLGRFPLASSLRAGGGGGERGEPSSSLPSSSAQSVRWDLVRRVRREIAQGRYETPEKLRALAALLRGSLE